MNESDPQVTGNELKLFQREMKAMFAAQETPPGKLDAHLETAAGMLSDLTESIRHLSQIEGRLERRLDDHREPPDRPPHGLAARYGWAC